MIVWIFMILDLVSFFQLSLLVFGQTHSNFALILSGAYLIGKGFLFRDVMSIVDAIWGIYIFIALSFGIHLFIYAIILFWVLYKVLFLIAPFLELF